MLISQCIDATIEYLFHSKMLLFVRKAEYLGTVVKYGF